eukprot:scaffold14009_cov110-Isochrysis_galbana.AAC.6
MQMLRRLPGERAGRAAHLLLVNDLMGDFERCRRGSCRLSRRLHALPSARARASRRAPRKPPPAHPSLP